MVEDFGDYVSHERCFWRPVHSWTCYWLFMLYLSIWMDYPYQMFFGYLLFSILTNFVPYEPMFRDVGLRITESEYCSNIWASPLVTRLEAKNNVKNSLGIPIECKNIAVCAHFNPKAKNMCT